MDVGEDERNGERDALAHPWLKPFVKDNEWALDRWELCADESLNIDDDTKMEVSQYRDQLYQHLRELRKDAPSRLAYFGAGVRAGSRLAKAAGAPSRR